MILKFRMPKQDLAGSELFQNVWHRTHSARPHYPLLSQK